MGQGKEWVEKHDLSSLRILGSVGEPINPEAWHWYHERGRQGPLPDRRHLVADRDRRHPDHAAAGRDPDQAGLGDPAVLRGAAGGARARAPARRSRRPRRGRAGASPTAGRGRCARSTATTQRFVETYFSQYKGYYFTGDGCRRDADGYYWITGRVDDVLNVSGHRMGTAEVESALVAHPKVAEAAVVGYPHAIKGQGIYAYVTLMTGEDVHRGAAPRARSAGCARRSARSPRPT